MELGNAMGSQVIYLPNSGVPHRSAVCQRLTEVIAIFEQVDAEELLAALPQCPIAQRNHLAALNLFLGAETDLRELLSEMSEIASV